MQSRFMTCLLESVGASLVFYLAMNMMFLVDFGGYCGLVIAIPRID